jgi:predicted transcriptional regulator of viral defense system
MDLLGLIKQMQKTSIAEISNIAGEAFNIDRETLNKLIGDLESKGKIKRLDENFVKIA